MSAHGKRWQLREPPSAEFVARLGCGTVVATLFYQRDLHEPEAVAGFLDDTYPKGLHNPLLMRGMPEAVARLVRAIHEREPIAVYGDFDADGVTAVALLMQAIAAWGGDIRPYIPHREREGYGLNREAVEQLSAEGVRLLITVDCGISNRDEVAFANERGLDVIVTDHHQPPPVLPPALAVVNPKQPGCPYPFKQLVGVGIAFKLVQALFRQGLRFDTVRARDLLDLVALGTIADMGPLYGENRVLVKAGLEAMRETQRPGLLALIRAAGVKQKQIASRDIGFSLGPRINAAGRLDDAILAYQLLLADDLATAEQLAGELNLANRQRQEITQQVMGDACEQAEATAKHQQPIVVLESTDYPAGVVGLVAGKLVEQWARPVVLIARGSEVSRGSARSIPTFNIFKALSACRDAFAALHPGQDLFIRFGGHSMAAGFSIRNEYIEALETGLQSLAAQQLTEALLQPTLHIDVEVSLDEVTWDLLQALQAFEPFGEANHQPILLSRRVCVVGAWPTGTDGKHLKLQVELPSTDQNGKRTLSAIAFRLGHLAEPLRRHPWIDIAYTLQENTWNNPSSLQLNVKDFRRA